MDRQEPRDLADIFWLCCRDKLEIVPAIENPEGKAAGIFPPQIAHCLAEGLCFGVPRVAWRQAPSDAEFRADIEGLIKTIL